MVLRFSSLSSQLKALFQRRLLAVIIVLFMASMLGVVFSHLSTARSFVEQEARYASRTMAQTVFSARNLYSDSAVARVKDLPEVTVTYDYENYPHGIPLPATFLLELSESSVDGINSAMSIRYFSRYPFPWRQSTGGPRDTFEEEALTYLAQHPEKSFSRIEYYQGQTSLRYAVADRMKPTCVECHNTHPDSPKTDWKVGDMRGILEVNYPLDTLNENIQTSFNVHVTFILLTLGIGLVGLIIGLRTAIDRESRFKTNVALKQLNQDLEQRVEARTRTLERQQETLKLQDRAIMASSNGIIIVDARLPDSPTIFVNRAFETMTGYKAQEMIGQNCRLLQGNEHNQPGLQIIRHALKNGSAAKATVRNYRKDGSAFWNEISIAPIYDQGHLTHYIGIQQDVTDRIKTAEEAAQTNRLLDTICQAQSQFITAGNRLALFEGLLTGLLELTSSEYGFIGEVLFREDGYADIQDAFLKIRGVPYVKTHSVTNIAWDEETRKFYEENYQVGMEFDNMNTLFGAVITTEKPVIANNPATDPRSGGTPDGHPPLNAFLGLPLFSGQDIIGIVGIANRPNGYDQSVIDRLRPFLTTCSSLIEGYRLDRKRQQAEDSLKTSLNEKETLLKEIHHRVKNNLLVVSSLLSWQGEFSQDAEILKLLEDSQNRLSTIALIHEKLYRSTDLSHIDLGEYISSLAQQIFATLSPQGQSIQLHCDCTSILVNIETASPCGLIVNELMTNVLEHAFPNGRSGQVTVTLQQNDQGLMTLVVADDGIGFPEDFNYQQTESLGWQLICLLTEQLEGNVKIISPPGTRVVVTFAELAYRSRL